MRRGGRIVNVASRGAFRGEPEQPAYGASKAGLVAFGQSLARALGPHGIRVNAIVPGAIAGGGFAAPPSLVEKIALRRIGKPEDVAPMAVAVLSERFGGYVTGASLLVDGGLALHNWIEPPRHG
jgi:3-oxoacyl-[acyl-carrier protein] reductase